MSIYRSRSYRSSARTVLRWCAWYTKRLDAGIAAERQDEIASDLHEHGDWAERSGISPGTAAASVLWRAARGAPADLAWRFGALRHQQGLQAGRSGLARLASGGVALTWLTALVGIATVALGTFVLARVARALAIGDIDYVPRASVIVALLTLLAVVGTALLLSPRRRAAGALLLAAPALLISILSAKVLYYVSATTTAMAGSVPHWELLVALVGTALALLCAATALWAWAPTRASTRPVRERTSA